MLEEMDLEFSRTGDMVKQEERLAIYRTLSQPEERLYVSCSRIDETGGELRPSAVFRELENFLQSRAESDDSVVLGDLEDGEVTEIAVSPKGAISYLTDAFREYLEDGKLLWEDSWRMLCIEATGVLLRPVRRVWKSTAVVRLLILSAMDCVRRI